MPVVFMNGTTAMESPRVVITARWFAKANCGRGLENEEWL
jgi:hypothetical protein